MIVLHFITIVMLHEFVKKIDVSNPDGYKGWFCKFIQHRDNKEIFFL